MTNSIFIFESNKKSDLSNWQIVDDTVMGGRSNGNFYINEEKNFVFEGNVSLENNGGFSLLRYNFDRKKITGYTKVKIHLKGDKKRYQFRVKSNEEDRHSYISYFQTSGDWEIITLNLAEMIPAFRGQTLNLSNYEAENIEEIAFLIGNKKEENFKLEINMIEIIK